MTEQEMETLVARLTRIWEPEHEFERVQSNHSSALRFRLDDDVFFSCIGVGGGLMYRVTDLVFFLTCMPNGEITEDDFGEWRGIIWTLEEMQGRSIRQAQFANRWMPLFRRSCWLCGCSIEASAHEKAEWMQGFSREELQAWNLKL